MASSISEASPAWGCDGHGIAGRWSSVDPPSCHRDMVCNSGGGGGLPGSPSPLQGNQPPQLGKCLSGASFFLYERSGYIQQS